jgi:Fe-S cluster assembly protein SufD
MRGAYEAEADTWVDAQERWEVEGVDEYAVSLDSKPAEEEIRLVEY